MPNILDYGVGTGTEWAANNYPFVAPDPDTRGILADAWIAYGGYVKAPIRLTTLFNFGRVLGTQAEGDTITEHRCDVIISDADFNTLWDTRSLLHWYYTGQAFGDRFYIHEWQSRPVSADKTTYVNRTVIRLVQHIGLRDSVPRSDGAADVLRYTEEETDPRTLEASAEDDRRLEQSGNILPAVYNPESAVFDARTYSRTPERVMSFELGNRRIGGIVTFRAGANIQLNTGQTNQITIPGVKSTINEDETIIEISARNSTSSISSGCNGATLSSGIKSINNTITPDKYGNLLLSAKDCIYALQPAYTAKPEAVAPGTIQIGNHCESCCSCQDYVNAYDKIQSLSDHMAQVIPEAELIRDEYTEMLNIAQALAAYSQNNPLDVVVLGGVVQSSTNWSTSVTIAAMLANVDANAYSNVDMQIACTFPAATVAPSVYRPLILVTDDNGVSTPGTITGTWPNYHVTWASIGSGRNVRVQFTLCWSGALAQQAALTGLFKACVSASCSAGTIPLTASQYTACRSAGIT